MKQFSIDDLLLENITLSDASIDNPEGKTLNEQEQGILEFNLAFETLLNIDYEGVMIKLFVGIKCLDEKKEFLNIKANFTTQFIFKVKGLTEYFDENDKENYSIEPHLLTSIINIVYSTSRGIIYTRSLGTVLGAVILPILSSQKLIELLHKSNDEKNRINKELK